MYLIHQRHMRDEYIFKFMSGFPFLRLLQCSKKSCINGKKILESADTKGSFFTFREDI